MKHVKEQFLIVYYDGTVDDVFMTYPSVKRAFDWTDDIRYVKSCDGVVLTKDEEPYKEIN